MSTSATVAPSGSIVVFATPASTPTAAGVASAVGGNPFVSVALHAVGGVGGSSGGGGGGDSQMGEKGQKGGLDDGWSQPSPRRRRRRRRRLPRIARCRARSRRRAARPHGARQFQVRRAGSRPEVHRRPGLGGRRAPKQRFRRPRLVVMQRAGRVPTLAWCWSRGCCASSCGRAGRTCRPHSRANWGTIWSVSTDRSPPK